MPKTLLKVTVRGGTPPLSIVVQLRKGTKVIEDVPPQSGSFEHLFKNLSGKYSLFISGPNPLSPNRETIIDLNTDEIVLSADSPTPPVSRKGESYFVQFHFR